MNRKTAKTIFSLILIFASHTFFGQAKTTVSLADYKKLNLELAGKVKRLKVTNRDMSFNSAEVMTYDFDAAGLPVSIKVSGLGVDLIEQGLRDEVIEYIFKYGKLVSSLNTNIGLDGKIYNRDASGNVLLEKHYFSNILVAETESAYNPDNRITEKAEYVYGAFGGYDDTTQENKEDYRHRNESYRYDGRGNLISKYVRNIRNNNTKYSSYSYDNSNNLVEEGYHYIPEGQSDYKYVPLHCYEYDSLNRLVKEYQIAKFSPHNTDTYYKYDEKGNQIEIVGYYIYPDKEPVVGFHITYQYNEFGKMTKDDLVVGENRSILFDDYKTEIFKYDDHQNMTAHEYITVDGSTIKVETFEYKYDDNGNWIERETKEGKNYDDLETVEISTREITYY